MANVLRFDPATGKVGDYLTSVHTPEYEGRSGVLINPVLPEGFGKKPRDWFVVAGGVVVEISTAEKQELADAQAAALIAQAQADALAVKASAKARFTSGADANALALQAVVRVLLTEINTLRAHPAIVLKPLEAPEIQAAIESAIDA